MADNAGDTPYELPQPRRKKLKEDSEFNKQWIDQLKRKNQQDEATTRPPLNRGNFGRVFTDKPKAPKDESN